MPDNIQKTTGRPPGYKFNRGGTPTEFGPFIGIVVNNIDPTRSGRLQVWIEQFGATNADGTPNLDDDSLWRTVSYIPPFYGVTPHTGTSASAGTFTGNQQSYGMWFTPPDLGTQVICFFVAGDPNQGFYTGCVPDAGVNHMIPAVGASRRYQLGNRPQDSYFAGASQLPVTEINSENLQISQDPRFFDKIKPVHSVVAGVMLQQGLIKDTLRGPITSNSQRESPSACFGISTPGKAVYQGGLSELDIKTKLERGQIRPQDIQVVARRGGHSIVMDDGDLEGRDTLLRVRTAKGHQITMSDDGDCFYIIHANGQTWLEFGKQGTVDVFSTNSVNVRTQGTINLHADKDINMFAGGAINIKSKVMKIEAEASLDILGMNSLKLYSKNLIGIKSDGSLALSSVKLGSWNAGATMLLKAGRILLNSSTPPPIPTPSPLLNKSLPDTQFQPGQGWTVDYGRLKTIVTRAPTHEPYPYHNQGVNTFTNLSANQSVALSTSTAVVLDGLDNVTVTDGIDTAEYLGQEPAEISVGPLDTDQVTGLLAQTSADVYQDSDEISLDKGIGEYGFSPQQLESAGYLKSGTVQTWLKPPAQVTQQDIDEAEAINLNGGDVTAQQVADNRRLNNILSSPTVWTGKSGVEGLGGLLSDPKLQSLTQNEIMVTGYNQLRQSGVITGRESPTDIAPLVQVASRFGINDTLRWLQGTAPADLVTQINAVAKNAQYAVNFVDAKTNDLVAGGAQIGGFTNTVQRDSLDQAVKDVLGNAKIPVPDFGSGLYSSTPDSSLTYTGDDVIVWDRINAERLRRGLPGLAAMGHPRPV